MAVIPEVILQKAIIQGFRAVRRDPRLLDTIFRQLHQDQLAAIKQYILETSIDFSINYPRKDFRAPSLVLLLKNESEFQTYLGDILGDGSDPFVPDPELTIDTLGGQGASTSNSSGLPRKLAGPLLVDRQEGTSTIYFQDSQLDLVEDLISEPVGSAKLYVVSGSGAGYIYDIIRIRSDSLDIVGSFALNLDNTSVVDVRVADDPELAVGEPSRVYTPSTNLLRKGASYEVTYYLQILAEQQDHVIYLYSVVKALLLSQRVFLESQGIQALRIGGSDFAPKTEYLPDEIFQRQMTLVFVYPFSFIEEQEVFSSIAVDLVPKPADELSSSVLLGTPFDLTIY